MAKLFRGKNTVQYLAIAAVIFAAIFYFRLKYTEGFNTPTHVYITGGTGVTRTIPASMFAGRRTLNSISFSTFENGKWVPKDATWEASSLDATATKVQMTLGSATRLLRKPSATGPIAPGSFKMPTPVSNLTNGITLTNLNTSSFGTLGAGDPANKDFVTGTPANIRATLNFA